jgi:ribonuclease HII
MFSFISRVPIDKPKGSGTGFLPVSLISNMTYKYENKKHKQGFTHIIGCDEVGRGCLAGPVVAAAVILPRVESKKSKVKSFEEIKDSKLLSPQKREELSVVIKKNCLAWGIGQVDEKIIDKINIHRATLAAMKLAVENLLSANSHELAPGGKTFVVIDGKFTIPDLNMEQEAVINGDNKILSIAAASIIAKVYRDDLMRKLHRKYPIYNFWQHKGYGTLLHRTMILQNGLSKVHRKSFCHQLLQT